MQVIIIGAGPSGLYTAIQLKKAGVKEVVIYDPRAGEYVRPGHINKTVIERAERGLGTHFNFPDKTAHIKDIERLLYQEARSLNIPIEQKEFLGFDPQQPGVILQDKLGMKSQVPCNYVMDCTGGKRLVIQAVNELGQHETKPFHPSLVTQDVLVAHHLLAFVKTNPRSLKVSTTQPEPPEITGMVSPLEFVRGLERLREFGWDQFAVPRCYNMPFDKDKACFYVEAPANLLPEQRMEWFQAVLEVRTGDDGLYFEQLPASRKYKDKPRLSYFKVNPEEISPYTYQSEGLPMVLIHGDGQIDPNYFLAHGIMGSFDRIDCMVKNMNIEDGEIKSFNQKEYELNVSQEVEKHRKALITHYQERKEYFISWLEKAKKHYETAASRTRNPTEALVFNERLKEINGRIAYYSALKIFEKIPSDSNVKIPILDLIEAKDRFILALKDLPKESKERKDVSMKVDQILSILENQAKMYHDQQNYDLSLRLYQEAQVLARHLSSEGVIRSKDWEAELCAKMMVIYRNMNRLSEGLPFANEVFVNPDLASHTKAKILFQILKGAADEIKGMSETEIKESKSSFIEEIKKIYTNNKEFVMKELKSSLKFELDVLDSLEEPIMINEIINSIN